MCCSQGLQGEIKYENKKTVHEWRNWLLEYVGDDKYELTQKDNLSVLHKIVAKNAMDAENQCQPIIKHAKEAENR